MALTLILKPHERMIIGGAVMKNGSKTTEFSVENNVSILREKDIMGEGEANSPCRRIYFVIQLMYIDNGKLPEYNAIFRELTEDVVKAAPSTLDIIELIADLTAGAKFYQALKVARKLINYEEELLKHVHEPI